MTQTPPPTHQHQPTEPSASLTGPPTNSDELKWFQHRWLGKHGKASQLKENRDKVALMRRWFESLDADGSGEVGLDELEDPLVSVGLARNRADVRELIERVDRDGSGEITFLEFLSMMYPERSRRPRVRAELHSPKTRVNLDKQAAKSPARPKSAVGKPEGVAKSPKRRQSQAAGNSDEGDGNAIVKLFEDLQAGKLGDLAVPFPVLITAYRRRMLLDAHMAEDPTARALGSSVLQALEATRRESKAPGARRQSIMFASGGAPPGLRLPTLGSN